MRRAFYNNFDGSQERPWRKIFTRSSVSVCPRAEKRILSFFFFFFLHFHSRPLCAQSARPGARWTLERARPARALPPHTRSLCVCSATENEGRPRRTITTKHIPPCPTAPLAQTETQALCVYRASQGETADLGPPLASLFFFLSEENSDLAKSSRTLSLKRPLRMWYVWSGRR